jgi:hypothetical protein
MGTSENTQSSLVHRRSMATFPITSSGRPINSGGMVRLGALAVFELMTSNICTAMRRVSNVRVVLQLTRRR